MNKIQTTIEEITPEFAAKLLEKNTKHQRKLNRNRVQQYMLDMKNNNWQLNGEAIIIGDQGTLLDGQHRLSAVIAADVKVKMLVIRGIEEQLEDGSDMFQYINTENRTNSDALYIEGYKDMNVNALTAFIKTVEAFKEKKLDSKPSGLKLTNPDIVSLANAYDREFLKEVIDEANEALKDCSFVGKTYWLLLIYLKNSGLKQMDEFVQKLRLCDLDEQNCPVSAALNWFYNQSKQKGNGGARLQKEKWFVLFSAYDKFIKDVKANRITVHKGSKIIYPTNFDDYLE
jgi:hypothetical protein